MLPPYIEEYCARCVLVTGRGPAIMRVQGLRVAHASICEACGCSRDLALLVFLIESLEGNTNMKTERNSFVTGALRILPTFLIVMLLATLFGYSLAAQAVGDGAVAISAAALSSEPWTDAQTVKPADLVKELEAKGNAHPLVVCTGFRVLYEGAHVPGAVFHGPASKAEGLDDLKKWAQGISRSSSIVLYCGCCPFDRCPNVRPAFEALRSMGFKNLRVLVLPNSFAKDWVEQGFAYDKGK